MLTNDRLARLAVSSLAAVVGGILLLDTCGNLFRAIGSWLLYSVVCAVLLNSREGEDLRTLSRLAILPAISPLLVLAYPALFLNQGICFSGVQLTGRASGFILGLCAFVFVASYCAISLFAFGRTMLLAALTASSTAAMAERIRRIDATVRVLTTLVGSAGLLCLALRGW